MPRNFGQAAAGTIKADEWHSLATLYLPIALATLWGDINGQKPASDDEHLAVLDNAMALFQAVVIAMRYTITLKLASDYQMYIQQWVGELGQLFPYINAQKKTRTNLHVVQHIYDFLLLFGPVISWWEFPFERLIGILQKVTTNGQSGGNFVLYLKNSHSSVCRRS